MVEAVSPLRRLSELGQSVWIDYLSRELLESAATLQADQQTLGSARQPKRSRKS